MIFILTVDPAQMCNCWILTSVILVTDVVGALGTIAMRTLLTELNVESNAYAASFILTVDPAVADPNDVITNDLSSGLFLHLHH